MGQLLRRTVQGDDLLAEWSPGEPESIQAAQQAYRHWLGMDYEAVRSDDGAHYAPLTGDELPLDAAQVILTTGMGGG